MSAHHAPDWVPHRSGTGIKHDGTFATWLSILSFTFFLATFVAANVYLRGWAPDKFTVDFGANADLPSYTTIVLLVAGFILLLAGSAYKQNAMKRFQGLMVVASLAFTAYAVMQMWLIVTVWDLGAAAWTTHLGIYVLQFSLALIDLVFIGFIGYYYSNRNDAKLRSVVPAAMSVFIYTVFIGITVLLITDMISIGQFAEWCGTRLKELVQ
jgi:uncharacterized membrane protein YozB (DUF420 family)